MTESEVEGRFFKISNKYVTQYSYYLSYEVSYVNDVTNNKRTIEKQSRVGCSYSSKRNDGFIFSGFWTLSMFDDDDGWAFSEITGQEWKRQMIKNAIMYGIVNDAGFFEAIEHIK